MDKNKIEINNDARKLFLTKGTCSATFFYLLNREFEAEYEKEVWAADILAGGIMRQGYQCGMLWGSALAIGAECYKKFQNQDDVIAVAIYASQNLVNSFSDTTNTVECAEITETDWTNALSMAKYAVTGKFMTCFNLAQNWAPAAVQKAKESLTHKSNHQKSVSCASEVLKKAGATDLEVAMVAGFAGGIGLSQNGCGALGAAIWLRSLRLIQKQNKKLGLKNPEAEMVLKDFQLQTDYKILCSEITDQKFQTPQEHTKYIQNGGCSKLIESLANSCSKK